MSVSRAVVSGLIPSRVKPTTINLVFTASLLHAQPQKGNVENKPASLLVVPFGKALSGITPSWCGRQMAATPKRARYSALIAFSWQEDKCEAKYNQHKNKCIYKGKNSNK